jgi:hypothetical protein
MLASEPRVLACFNGTSLTVTRVEQLLRAIQDPNVAVITIEGFLSDVPGFRLAPHQEIRGRSVTMSGLKFREGGDGIQISSDNSISSLTLATSADRCAIWNDESVSSLGSINLDQVRTVGRVRMLVRDKIAAGHVNVRDLDIVSADSRAASERPQGFGVFVLQGALTLWNLQPDPAVKITADIIGVSVGRPDSPVLGSGVFVAGCGINGGTLQLQRLETGAVYSDGRIRPGTPDQITGGVFVLQGATVHLVNNLGPVTTYGPNDMALDNWGTVDQWFATEKVTTFGPSGIGFVNFGLTREIAMRAPIETFGQGARGFNVYAGTVEKAEFDRIVTHGDGAVGIQISQPTGAIFVRRGIETFGGTGPSLVKGVIQQLPAIALSIKPGSRVDTIQVNGGLKTHGSGTVPFEQLGSIRSLMVSGGSGPDNQSIS